MRNTELFDVTIIGGGPVGLFGAFYAGLRGLKTLIVDSLPQLGGQLTALYPEKMILDVPGFSEILAKDLAVKLIEQTMRFNPVIELNQKCCDLQKQDNYYVLSTDKNNEFKTRTIIIAAGAGAFAPKKLTAPGVNELEGKGVQYGVADPDVFKGKQVVLVGGGDSAIDWALHLIPIAEKVTLVHRNDRFRAHPTNVSKLYDGSVNLMTFCEVKQAVGGDKLEKVVLYNNRLKSEIDVHADALILNIGFSANLGPLKDWGIDITGNNIAVDNHFETSLPGVFSAGDVVDYESKLKLIVTGFGEITTAVCYAHLHINPDEDIFPGHSSDMNLETSEAK